jgi:hypothetical protein
MSGTTSSPRSLTWSSGTAVQRSGSDSCPGCVSIPNDWFADSNRDRRSLGLDRKQSVETASRCLQRQLRLCKPLSASLVAVL